ncbi:unnamed protein product [Brassica rapa subsp. trilocularis]
MVSWSPYILKSVALSESNAVLNSFSVLRCKGIPQNRSPTNAAITTVLLIEAHAAFGVDGCKGYHSLRSPRRRKASGC